MFVSIVILPLNVYLFRINRRLNIVFIDVLEVPEMLICIMRLSRAVSFFQDSEFISKW